MKYTGIILGITFFLSAGSMSAQGGCSSILPSIEEASLDEVSKDYLRLHSYNNPYCDTANSDYDKLMHRLADMLEEVQASPDMVLEKMGKPYYRGALADYEKQKLTLGRDGKPTGKALPPSYKIPTGDYFIVYYWKNEYYLVHAFKAGKLSEARWWKKGDFR